MCKFCEKGELFGDSSCYFNLKIYNAGDNHFLEILKKDERLAYATIDFCPVCGRKLKKDAEVPADDSLSPQTIYYKGFHDGVLAVLKGKLPPEEF